LLYKNENISLAATLIYFSYPLVQAAAKNLTTDLYLTTFIFTAVYTFILYRQQQRSRFLYLFYIFCGLAFLTKGPVGLMPQGLFAIFYSRIQRMDKRPGVHAFIAPLIGLIICASWFLVLVINNPAFLDYFVKHQLVDRVASDAFSRAKPWWYYLLTIPLLAMPAFMYFVGYLRGLFLKRQFVPVSKAILLSLGISLVVFSLSSSKLVFYVLPLYLFIVILSAKHIVTITEKNRSHFEKVALIFSTIIFCSMIAACFIPTDFVIPLIPVLVFCGLGLVISFLVFFNKKLTLLKAPLLSAIFMVIITLLMPFIMKRNEVGINSVKPLAAFIKTQSGGKPGASIMVYDQLLPSLNFYTGKNIITIYNSNNKARREIQFEDSLQKGTKNYIDLSLGKDSSSVFNTTAPPPGFIIAKPDRDIPDSLFYLRAHLKNRIVKEKWIVYY